MYYCKAYRCDSSIEFHCCEGDIPKQASCDFYLLAVSPWKKSGECRHFDNYGSETGTRHLCFSVPAQNKALEDME